MEHLTTPFEHHVRELLLVIGELLEDLLVVTNGGCGEVATLEAATGIFADTMAILQSGQLSGRAVIRVLTQAPRRAKVESGMACSSMMRAKALRSFFDLLEKKKSARASTNHSAWAGCIRSNFLV